MFQCIFFCFIVIAMNNNGIAPMSMTLNEIQRIGTVAGQKLQAMHEIKRDVRETTPIRTYSQVELHNMLKSTNRPISRNTLSAELAKMEKLGHTFDRPNGINFSLTQQDCIDVADFLNVEKYRTKTDGKAYVVVNQNLKGGVGKSMGTGLVATALTNMIKYILHDIRVCIIDLDPQATSTQQHTPSARISDGDYTSIALMCDDTDADEIRKFAVAKTENRNVDIIRCGTEDGFYADELDNEEVRGNQHFASLLLERVIKKIECDYDIIFLDAGPHMDKVMKNCLWAANAIYIPVPSTYYNYDSTLRFLERFPIVMKQLVEEGLDLARLDFIKPYLSKVPNNGNAHDKDIYESASADLNDIFTFNSTVKQPLPHEDVYERCAEMQRTIFTMKAKDYPGSNEAFKRALTSAEQWATELIEGIMYYHKKRGSK
ncbi:TPA: AAA family ATPase [Vibrio vulnificus]|nr:ParA family protein [Vibrio navarrensis]HAS6102124.1 AAA family ATPase [Vibrio vulnificus]